MGGRSIGYQPASLGYAGSRPASRGMGRGAWHGEAVSGNERDRCLGGAQTKKDGQANTFCVDVGVPGSIFGGDECHSDAQGTLVLEKGFG